MDALQLTAAQKRQAVGAAGALELNALLDALVNELAG
jgi:hypothetical protein